MQRDSMSIRPVKRPIRSKPTRYCASVHLRRAISFGNISGFDPYVLAAS
jgi:hypothetical protein